jgi:hypothetical protein
MIDGEDECMEEISDGSIVKSEDLEEAFSSDDEQPYFKKAREKVCALYLHADFYCWSSIEPYTSTRLLS